jgi:hypothetical protein
MTIREELEVLHAQQREIEVKIAALYRASVEAPVEEKACPDFMAKQMDEPMVGIEYPITVTGIAHRSEEAVMSGRRAVGSFVAIRPCDKDLAGKTFLGVYLGDIATDAGAAFNRKTGVLEVGLSMHNPAIWVPDLKRIVFGMESWWGVLRKPDDLKQITDADIQNVWYVKALQVLEGGSAA